MFKLPEYCFYTRRNKEIATLRRHQYKSKFLDLLQSIGWVLREAILCFLFPSTVAYILLYLPFAIFRVKPPISPNLILLVCFAEPFLSTVITTAIVFARNVQFQMSRRISDAKVLEPTDYRGELDDAIEQGFSIAVFFRILFFLGEAGYCIWYLHQLGTPVIEFSFLFRSLA